MHSDEAVNAVKFSQLQWGDGYRYDPHEYHGPTLPYLTLASRASDGAEDFVETDKAMYRWVSVVCGLAVVGLTLLLGWAIGWRGALWAGLFCAVSPMMVFFSRYYIH